MPKLIEALVLVTVAAAAGCYAEPAYGPGPAYGDGTYAPGDGAYDPGDTGDPSAAYVATTNPVYYGGRANYWYGNAWRYHANGRWNTYGREPAGLHGYRPGPGRSYGSTHRYEGGRSGGGITRGGGGARGGGGGGHGHR